MIWDINPNHRLRLHQSEFWRTNKNFRLVYFFRIEKRLSFIETTYIRAFSQFRVLNTFAYDKCFIDGNQGCSDSHSHFVAIPWDHDAPIYRGSFAPTFRRSAHVSCDMNNNLWDDYVARMPHASVSQRRISLPFIIEPHRFFDSLSTIERSCRNMTIKIDYYFK